MIPYSSLTAASNNKDKVTSPTSNSTPINPTKNNNNNPSSRSLGNTSGDSAAKPEAVKKQESDRLFAWDSRGPNWRDPRVLPLNLPSTTPSSDTQKSSNSHTNTTSTSASSSLNTVPTERPNSYSSLVAAAASGPGGTGRNHVPSSSVYPYRSTGMYEFGGRNKTLFDDKVTDAASEARKERERAWDKERDVAAKKAMSKSAETSPTQSTSSNLYPRPSQPPSPSVSRALPSITSGVSTAKSPQPTPVGSSASRPQLPLPGFASLQSRGIYPFDVKERPGAASQTSASADEGAARAGGSGHTRSLSGSSSRPGDNLASLSASPAAQPSQPRSTLFGTPASTSSLPFNRERELSRDADRASVTPASRDSVKSPTSATAQAKPTTTMPSSGQPSARSPYSFSSSGGYGGNYTSGGSFGFGLGGFGNSMGYYHRSTVKEEDIAKERKREQEVRERDAIRERELKERERERERARERERELVERERRIALEKERAMEMYRAKEQREREEKVRLDKEREERDKKWAASRGYNTYLETTPFQPPRSGSAYASTPSTTTAPSSAPTAQNDYRRPGGPVPPYHDSKYTRHIEVLNRPETQPASSSSYNSNGELSVMQQVVPSREPRPYGYKAEPTPAPSREYTYQPRDKRPRMDAAVEDQGLAAAAHRRGSGPATSSASKSKRKKEEEKKENGAHAVVHQQQPIRDFTALTTPIKRYPEITNGPIEAWLKNIPDLTRVVCSEVYTGPGWNLSLSAAVRNEGSEGGTVIVRIGGGFLGKNWKVRGETGWDEASPIGTENSVIGLGWSAEDSADAALLQTALAPPPTASSSSSDADVVHTRLKNKRQIWGTDVYTDDSDLGLVLIHAGWIRWGGSQWDRRKGDKETDDDGVTVVIRIFPRLVRYTGAKRNVLVTRSWGNGHDGKSIVIERCERIKIDKTYINKRSNKKARLADYALQRQLIFGNFPSLSTATSEGGILALKEDTRKINLADVGDEYDYPAMVSAPNKSFALKYSPKVVENALLFFDDGCGGGESLWANDLELYNEDETYIFFVWPDRDLKSPLISVLLKLPDKTREFARKLKVSDITWLDEGVAFRKMFGWKGSMIRVNGYRWVKRTAFETQYDSPVPRSDVDSKA